LYLIREKQFLPDLQSKSDAENNNSVNSAQFIRTPVSTHAFFLNFGK